MFLDQEFQTQLVDIDKERTKFYGKDKEGEESAAERQIPGYWSQQST